MSIMQLPPENPHEASFLLSVAEARALPRFPHKEVVFFGASNVGKSSLINAFCRRKNLAKTSKTPGRTQLLNFFWLPQKVILVDAPGYGFANIPDSVRQNWQDLLLDYLDDRQGKLQAYLLMDSRRWIRDHDMEIMKLLQIHNIPYVLVFTKLDKLSKIDQQDLQNRLQQQVASACPALVTSAKTKEGLEGLQKSILAWGSL